MQSRSLRDRPRRSYLSLSIVACALAGFKTQQVFGAVAGDLSKGRPKEHKSLRFCIMMYPNSYEKHHYSLGEEDQFSTYDEIYHLKEAASSDNHPLSMDKLLMLAYMIGRNHGIKEQRNNELLSLLTALLI